jgi:hypothetical protein
MIGLAAGSYVSFEGAMCILGVLCLVVALEIMFGEKK